MLAGKKVDPPQISAEGGNKPNASEVQTSAPPSQNETRNKLAKIAGVSHDTIDNCAQFVGSSEPANDVVKHDPTSCVWIFRHEKRA